MIVIVRHHGRHDKGLHHGPRHHGWHRRPVHPIVQKQVYHRYDGDEEYAAGAVRDPDFSYSFGIGGSR